jgi:HSP20 family protein
MADDLIRWMQTLFMPAAGSLEETCWRPAADVYHCADSWWVKLDLAGVRPEDISVGTCGQTLIVRGCRRDHHVQEDYFRYRLEIAYSRFERRIELPFNVDGAVISTQYCDGMLLVRIEEEAQL